MYNRIKLINFIIIYKLPIWRITDATLVYESTKENQYEKIAYRLDNLENGKNYQIGIFPCTKDDVICLSPIQLIGQPRYIRPKQVIDYDYVLNRKEIVAKKINITKDISINKDIYMTEGTIDIGKFIWKEDRFSACENTTLWFEALYPLLEGGELTFTIYNNKPCRIQVYINQLNVFNITLNRQHVYFSTNDKSFISNIINTVKLNDNNNDNRVNIKIIPQHYSKIIIDVQSEYDDCVIDIKDLQLNYYTGEEKYNDLINN